MSRLEVLVTTMHQSDFHKYKEMNLQTDAVIANQSNQNAYAEKIIDGSCVKLVTSNTRGVSRNRNLALAFSNQHAEFLLFSDDDLIFNDGYEQKIIEEFDTHPKAEAIKFNLHDLSASRQISMKKIGRFEKASRRNMSSSGVWGLVIRQSTIKKYNLTFHENFGPGTEHYCGEDTIFLMRLIDKGIKFYRSPIDIAGIDQTESCWFNGYNQCFFETSGMVIAECYPLLCYVIVLRSALKFSMREKCKVSFGQILKWYYAGIKNRRNEK